MGRRGPKPEPAAVKAAKGNPGRRRVGADPVTPAGTTAKVAAPAWLKGAGLTVWKRLAPRVEGLKLLTAVDAEAFARYCRSLARWHQMQAAIDKQGLVYHVKSNHGEWDRAHPLLGPADRLEVRLTAFEDRFGLNPAERQRIFAARAALPSGDLFAQPAQTPPASKAPTNEAPVGFLQ